MGCPSKEFTTPEAAPMPKVTSMSRNTVAAHKKSVPALMW
jgi:hypothetical protein